MKMRILSLGALAALCTALAPGEEPEQGQGAALSESDLPAPVAAAVRESVPGAAFQKAHTERENGALVYEAMVLAADGRVLEVVVDEAGNLVEVEEEIGLADLPAGVAARVAELLAGAAPEEVEKSLLVLYEVEKKVDGASIELVMDALGQVQDMAEEGQSDDDGAEGEEHEGEHRGEQGTEKEGEHEEEDEDEDEGEISVAELPAAVVATVNALLPGASIDEAEMEREGGEMVYEVEVELAGDREMEVAVLEDGTLLEVEEEIKLGALPAAVAATLAQVLPGGKVQEVTRKTLVVYEVEATIDGEAREFAMDALGRVLSLAPDVEE